jgi:hypothetical protein
MVCEDLGPIFNIENPTNGSVPLELIHARTIFFESLLGVLFSLIRLICEANLQIALRPSRMFPEHPFRKRMFEKRSCCQVG